MEKGAGLYFPLTDATYGTYMMASQTPSFLILNLLYQIQTAKKAPADQVKCISKTCNCSPTGWVIYDYCPSVLIIFFLSHKEIFFSNNKLNSIQEHKRYSVHEKSLIQNPQQPKTQNQKQTKESFLVLFFDGGQGQRCIWNY